MSQPWARSVCSGGAMRWTLPPELRTGHPVADAVRNAAQSHQLPAELLEALIDARSVLLDATSPLTEDGFRDFLWKAEGALFALGAHVVGLSASAQVHAGCVAAGQAYGLARMLLELPRMLAARPYSLGKGSARLSGLDCRGTACGRGRRRQNRGVARRLLRPDLPQFGRGAAIHGHLAAGVARQPSFLWPWSSLICGLSSGRAVRCCARKRALRPSPGSAGLPPPICLAGYDAARRGALEGKRGRLRCGWWRSGGTLWRGSS